MSDLVVSNNTDSILDELELSLFPGLDVTAPEREAKFSIGYTSRTRVDGIRVINSDWQSGKDLKFAWNVPGNSDQIEEFEDDIPVIKGIKGFIVHSELQPSLKISDPSNPSGPKKTLCSLYGYKKPDGTYIKGLPATLNLSTSKKNGGVYGTMYDSWNNTDNRPNVTDPHHDLAQYEFLGSGRDGKLLSCMDCIKCGKSTEVDPVTGKENECQLEGRIYIYATHLIKYSKGNPIEISIQNLLGEEGIILQLNLPNKIGLIGKYNSDPDLNRNTYLRFLTELHHQFYKNKNYAVTNPSFYHEVKITVKPPIGDGKYNYLNFEEITCDREACKRAMAAWLKLHPYQEPETLDSSNWVINGVGGSTMYSTAKIADYNDNLPMLEATEEPSNIPF